MPNNRQLFLSIFIICATAVAYAFYAQYSQHITPCPLCIAERIIIATSGCLSLLFALHNPKNYLRHIYGVIILGIGLFGIKIVARHIWLINLPPDQQPTSCGMPLEVLFQRIPLNGFISYVLRGDGECAKVTWQVFGVSAPNIVLLLFSMTILMSICVIFNRKA